MDTKVSKEEIIRYIPGLTLSKEEEWLNKEWYHQRFDGSPYLIHMIAEAEITTRRDKKHGLYFDRHFCFFEDGKADWYIDVVEIKRIVKKVLELRREYPNLGKTLMKEYEPLEKDFYTFCKKIERTNLHGLSNNELIELHDAYLQSILNRNSSSSMIDGFALGTDSILEENIKKAYEKSSLKKEMGSSEVFSILTTPSHSSFVRDAELDFFRLVSKIKRGSGNKKELIRDYRDKYFWTRNNYVDANVLTVDFFEQEVARMESSGLDVDAEIKRIEALPKENKEKKNNLLRKLDLDDETLFLLEVTEDFTQWQDERKKATMFTAHYMTIILAELGKRTNLTQDLLKYMSPREVSKIFIDTPTRELLEKRRYKSLLYWDTEGHEVLMGDVVDTIKKKLLSEKNHDDVQDFRGMTAALGKAQGRVRVLKSVKEVDRIQDGDVLVAVMTRPDYVPAMKKACAIVTDEGGITSHAAIVSRELKIPCVIGTKIATQVLKDGDLVQVNANHGLVRIVERAG